MNTKTLPVIILLITFATASLSAQAFHQLGLTFGSNYSSLRSDLFPTASGRLSYAVGAVLHVGFNDRFGLSQDIVLTQKGGSALATKFRPEQTPEQQNYNYHYTAYQTTILANFQPFANFPVRLQAGGYVELLANRLKRDNYDSYIGECNEDELYNAMLATKLNEAFTGVDFGPAVGISIGSSRFRVNAQYHQGMQNLYKNLDFVESGHAIRTSSVRLSLVCFLK